MRVKLAGVLIATLLVFGMVFGAGQATAASLPGEPLYGLKLAAEQARVELTSDPESKAALAAELAENRFAEIAQMVAAGTAVDGDTAFQAQQQLSWAYQASRQISGETQKLQAQERFAHMLQYQHGVMTQAVDGAALQQQEPVRALLRTMERVRNEVHAGEGEASGEQTRTNRDEVPQPTGPVGEPGAGQQGGQDGDDGLLDATGTGTQGGQDGTVNGPSSGPGPENPDGSMGPYEGEGPGYGPGPDESQEGTEEAPGPFGWLRQLLKKQPASGGGSSSGSSGSSSSGGSSGSSSSGSGDR